MAADRKRSGPCFLMAGDPSESQMEERTGPRAENPRVAVWEDRLEERRTPFHVWALLLGRL